MSTAADNWFPRHRINVDEYHRMAEVGLLAPDARVELIEGEVMDMAPIGKLHAGKVDWVAELLTDAVRKQFIVAVQRPIGLASDTELQPDVALLKRRPDFYCHAYPGPTDVLLLVEVSDSSLRYDQRAKIPLYAKHGIPEVWLLDVQAKQLHCMRKPRAGIYEDIQVFASGSIGVACLPGVIVPLDDLLSG
jgi:Uma2 family endonuclease